MRGPCMCGDTACPSCGTAQGTYEPPTREVAFEDEHLAWECDDAPSDNVKKYLGDAVYVEYDGWRLTLTTEDGVRTTNTVVLEPDVYYALVDFVKKLNKNAPVP